MLMSYGYFMRNKHICVLIHVRIKGDTGTMFKLSSNVANRSRLCFFVDLFLFMVSVCL